ncbi:hypothetical protein [Pseudomonas sp. S2_F03]
MKKLLIILHDLSAGGAEKMMTRLAGALVDAGNDVTLLMLTGGGVNAAYLDPRVKRSNCAARAVQGPYRHWCVFFDKTASTRNWRRSLTST